MEVPENIYLQEPTKVRIEKKYDNDFEYTRTDAFIEKACQYLEPILTEYAGFYVGGEILEHFKKHMKGE